MWLARTPSAVVMAHARMLPRLDAEESILFANRVAMGSGTMKKEDAARVAQMWDRASTGDTQPVESAPKRKPDPEQLRARGFGVRRVRKPRVRKPRAV